MYKGSRGRSLSALPLKGPYLQKSMHSKYTMWTIEESTSLHTNKRLSCPYTPQFANNSLTHLGITQSTPNPSNCKHHKVSRYFTVKKMINQFSVLFSHVTPIHHNDILFLRLSKVKIFPKDTVHTKKPLSRGVFTCQMLFQWNEKPVVNAKTL